MGAAHLVSNRNTANETLNATHGSGAPEELADPRADVVIVELQPRQPRSRGSANVRLNSPRHTFSSPPQHRRSCHSRWIQAYSPSDILVDYATTKASIETSYVIGETLHVNGGMRRLDRTPTTTQPDFATRADSMPCQMDQTIET